MKSSFASSVNGYAHIYWCAESDLSAAGRRRKPIWVIAGGV